MKHLFIVNPIAGGKDKRIAVSRAVSAAFEKRDGEYEVYITKAPMDAVEKIKADAACCDHLRVYACGGDGTFNECVCGAALRENVAVCPFPTGTGNDFCRMFGEEKELFRNLEALLDGTEHPIDLIDCNGRYSANICSVGIDARIGTEVHKYSKLPPCGRRGRLYGLHNCKCFQGINRPMRIQSDNYNDSGAYALLCVCNGRYYGGGFNPSPNAMPDDGMLDIYVVPGVSLFHAGAISEAMPPGRRSNTPKSSGISAARRLHIDFEEENVVNMDGEAMFAKAWR